MNFLAMRLLQVLDDDSVFYLLTQTISKNKQICILFHYIDENFMNPGFVTRQNWVFQTLLEKHLPKVNKTLQSQSLEPVMYTPSWFLTLFSKSLQDEKFYRFFDCFLVEGYVFIFKTAIALIELKEKTILENEME